jgi:site-specific recombinase XerD
MTDKTLGGAMNEYMEHLRERGKSERTLYTYARDAEQITAFFGADRKLSGILTPHVGKFLKSDALLRLPSGKERAEPTVRKTVRVLRMFLVWARDEGYIEKAPLPKDVPMGRNSGEAPGTSVDPGVGGSL